MLRIMTIGVYGFDGGAFLRRLQHADVRLLLDVRQRRGVRGPEYAWANSRRLQAALADARIAYKHHPELAPTTELRQVQYAEDDRQGWASGRDASSRPTTPAATPPRSSTAPTSRPSCQGCHATEPPLCSASNATRKPATAR